MKVKRYNGSITVFLSLIFLIILSLVCTVIESSRVSSAYSKAHQIGYISLDSVFSSYAREVFEDYGIMVLCKSKEEIAGKYNDYIKGNLSDNNKYYVKNFYGLECKSIEVSDVQFATDNDGENIYDQIIYYMKFGIAEDVLDEIIGRCTSLDENEDVETFYQDLEGCNLILNEMEDAVGKVKENVDVIKGYSESPKEILENMKSNLENIMATVGDDDYSKEVRDNYFNIYKIYLRKYLDWNEIVGPAFDNIIMNTNIYISKVEEAKDYLDEMKENLEIMEMGGLSEELYTAFYDEIHILNEEIISQENDVYKVYSNEESSIEQREIFIGITKSLERVIDENIELEYSGNKLSNYDGGEELIKNTYECVNEALDVVAQYNNKCLDINYTISNGKKGNNDIVDFVNEIKKNGVIGYVASGEISGKSIDISELPSKICEIEHCANWKKYNNSEDTVRKALAGQYILDKFKSYVDKSNNAPLDYEIEYILCGNKSDKENLRDVVDEIVTIRTGFNLIYLVKDTVKRNEAYEMALSIVGYSCMPVLVRVTQFLIMGSWAYAEAVVDARDLLKGYKVKVIKNADEWNLSLTGIKNLESDDRGKESRSGLGYEDYLRFLLFKQNKSEQVYRIMDLIELNVQAKYSKTFKMNDAVINVKMETEFMMNRLFSSFGYSGNYIKNKRRKFSINVNQSYGY